MAGVLSFGVKSPVIERRLSTVAIMAVVTTLVIPNLLKRIYNNMVPYLEVDDIYNKKTDMRSEQAL